MGEMRKGQVFILGAIIFVSLLTMASFSSDTFIQNSEESNFHKYYQQSLEVPTSAFNDAIEDDYSSDHIKRKIYSVDRFIDAQTSKKSIDYQAFQFFVMPQEGEYVFINYLNSSVEAKIAVDGSWSNTTVDSKQNLERSYSSGKKTFRVIVSSENIDRKFDASTPRLLNRVKMGAENEKWSSSILY